LGFIPEINSYHTTAKYVKQQMMETMKGTNETIPNFEVVTVRVSTGKGKTWEDRVEGYKIQCIQRNASQLAGILRSGTFLDTPVVVPYFYRTKNRQAFLGALTARRNIK